MREQIYETSYISLQSMQKSQPPIHILCSDCSQLCIQSFSQYVFKLLAVRNMSTLLIYATVCINLLVSRLVLHNGQLAAHRVVVGTSRCLVCCPRILKRFDAVKVYVESHVVEEVANLRPGMLATGLLSVS